MLTSLLKLAGLTAEQIVALGQVVETACSAGDTGVIEWADRAVSDARLIGHMRQRDVETLNRLQRTYNGQFYTSGEYATTA
jgi:hypothetical protein